MFQNKFLVFSLFLLCVMPFSAFAQVSTVQSLFFGHWISLRNDAQYDITVNTDGSFSADPSAFIMIASPTQGIYDITTPSLNASVVSVDITQFSPLSGGIGSFQMLDFQELHSPSSDGAGVVRVTIGGTARTSGSGTPYSDVTRSGSIDVEINF